MQQIGFAFGDAAPAFALAAPGTWCPDRYTGTAAEHAARLDAAEAALMALAGPARPLFKRHIAAKRAGLAAQIKRMAYEPGDVFEIWVVRERFEVEDVTPLLEHCRAMVGSDFEGIEYKRQDRPQMASAGLYVRGVGSLVVRIWPGLSAGIDFRLIERDTFFLDSFRDGSPTIDAPANLWPRNMCQRFCESETAVPVAMTKTINGREYLVNGTTTGGQAGATAEAWTLVPASEWDGPPFTYRSMIDAYDAGTLERGDHRGQMVTVRGVLCVPDSYALLTDANGLRNYLDRDTSEDEPEQLPDDEEISDEEAEALELCARSGQTAINCARREIITKPPRGARFIARLAEAIEVARKRVLREVNEERKKYRVAVKRLRQAQTVLSIQALEATNSVEMVAPPGRPD